MANIAAIKALRERTGAGMMDCKNALEACGNDVDKACDWLREKGIAKQAKKADRIAAEGLTSIKVCEKCHKALISEVNCETDFVAHSDAFKELVQNVDSILLEKGCTTLEEAKGLTENLFTDAGLKLGEKLSLRRFTTIEAKDGECMGSYVHMGGKITTVVILKKDNPELAFNIAVHIAANSPKYITEAEIEPEALAKEKEIQAEAVKNDEKLKSKPAQALEKIIEGKVHKVFAEMTLVDQEYLIDNTKTVGQLLKENDNEVVAFIRYQVGEGLEKRVDNFAEEVMAQASGK